MTEEPAAEEAGGAGFRTEGFSTADVCPPHQVQYYAEVQATCIQEGTKAHYHCAICQRNFQDEAATVELTAEQLTIPKTDHVWDAGVIVKATPAAGPKKVYTCTVCGTGRKRLCQS